jgi:hypothetical protein
VPHHVGDRLRYARDRSLQLGRRAEKMRFVEKKQRFDVEEDAIGVPPRRQRGDELGQPANLRQQSLRGVGRDRLPRRGHRGSGRGVGQLDSNLHSSPPMVPITESAS